MEKDINKTEPENPPSSYAGSQASVFRTTQWCVVRLAQSGQGSAAAENMERLARSYWYPLYAFARRQGIKEVDAQDLTQGFLARLVTGNHLQSVDASKGRFRSFLLACFKHYISDERQKAEAQKRGGGVEFVPLDASGAEERLKSENAPLDGEDHYDRDWAQSLMSEVLERLRLECKRTGKLEKFDTLLPFLVEDPSATEQKQVQKKLALSESGFRSALQRLRFRFGEYLWTEIAKTVSNISDVDQETRYVLEILSRTNLHQARK